MSVSGGPSPQYPGEIWSGLEAYSDWLPSPGWPHIGSLCIPVLCALCAGLPLSSYDSLFIRNNGLV